MQPRNMALMGYSYLKSQEQIYDNSSSDSIFFHSLILTAHVHDILFLLNGIELSTTKPVP